MSVIWIIEHAEAPHPRLASALIGDYAVRAFASLNSFIRLLRLKRSQLPDLLLIDATTQRVTATQLREVLDCHLPKTPIICVEAEPPKMAGSVDDQHSANGAVENLHVYRRPFDGLRLSAFVEEILQTSEISNPRSIVRYRGVMLDYHRLEYVVAPSEVAVALPRREAQLLRLFLGRPGVCLSREEICELIWENVHVTPRTIDSHMSRLRQRLAGAEVEIVTVYGGGYMLK